MNNVTMKCHVKDCKKTAIFFIKDSQKIWECCKEHSTIFWKDEKYVSEKEYLQYLKLQILK